jgi:hypothetical protein
MGKKHFEQMHAAALETDCRATANFLDLVTAPPPHERRLYGRGFWESHPVDVIMDRARGLVPLADAFHTAMKQLLLEGKVHVFVRTPNGQLVKIKDPKVFTFDDVHVTPSAFTHMMMTMPAQLCSGDQNG